MPASHRWTFRPLAAAALFAAATPTASAQVVQKTAPGGAGQSRPAQPKNEPPKNPFAPIPIPATQPTRTATKSSTYLMPSVSSWPGIPMTPIYAQTPMLFNPALDNPWMNQVTVTRYPANPFTMNPLLANSPLTTYAPPLAIREPGTMLYQGPDLQVNPTSGTVYHPVSGTVTLPDGSTFYRVPGSGVSTPLGNYSSGTGLYYNPMAGTFFNPASGVLSRPGRTNIYLPYIW
jgi:hypothetical protein